MKPLSADALEVEVALASDGAIDANVVVERIIQGLRAKGKVTPIMAAEDINKILEDEHFFMTYKGERATFQVILYWEERSLKRTFRKIL
ncbi:MAG: hypothetical protein K2W94_05290 [Alphaproteobacteria bacterium]|nr:hypothetical protein [Alphaproteobacteria bacterium]